MGLDGPEAATVGEIQKLDRRVIAGTDEDIAVRCNGEARHPGCVAFQRPLFREVGHVEQLDRLVTTPGDQ